MNCGRGDRPVGLGKVTRSLGGSSLPRTRARSRPAASRRCDDEHQRPRRGTPRRLHSSEDLASRASRPLASRDRPDELQGPPSRPPAISTPTRREGDLERVLAAAPRGEAARARSGRAASWRASPSSASRSTCTASDEHPSLRNKKRVDCQWVFFWRDAAARDELDRLLDQARSISAVDRRSEPVTRHAFLALRIDAHAVEVCFAVPSGGARSTSTTSGRASSRAPRGRRASRGRAHSGAPRAAGAVHDRRRRRR